MQFVFAFCSNGSNGSAIGIISKLMPEIGTIMGEVKQGA
jgi:hypothetical protein